MSLFTKPRIDREVELDTLRRVTRGKTPQRTALIHAASGIGKSELLREFMARNQSDDCPLVMVDFKGGGLSLADTLFQVCDTLGWPRFQMFAETVQKIVHPLTINMSDNVLIGQNDIAVALGGPDEQTREMHRARLTQSFITDLRANGHVALIFDVFEQCDAPLQGWFANVFLPYVHRSSDLAVIIAGQSVPEDSTAWESIRISLECITPEHWHQHCLASGLEHVSLERLRGFCEAPNVRTLEVATYISAQSGSRR